MRFVRYTYPTPARCSSPASVFGRSPWSGLESEIDRLFNSTQSDLAAPKVSERIPVDLV